MTLKIHFICTNCRRNLSMNAEHVGKHVTCPNCGQWCTVPDPGAESVKLRCQDCGTEHERDHSSECDACGSEDYDLWCAVHRNSVKGGTCMTCVEEHTQKQEEKPRAPVGTAMTTVTSSPPATFPASTSTGSTAWTPSAAPSPHTKSPTPKKPPIVTQPIGSAVGAMIMGIIALTMVWLPLFGVALGLASCAMAGYVYVQVNDGTMGKEAMPYTIAALVCGGLGLLVSLIALVAS